MLADDDRQKLYEQVARRIRVLRVLLDVDWIFELATSHDSPVDDDAIDRAIDDVLERERTAHEQGERPADAERDRYRVWTDVFQLELADARRAAVTFNSLDEHTRRVFFALIIEEQPLSLIHI